MIKKADDTAAELEQKQSEQEQSEEEESENLQDSIKELLENSTEDSAQDETGKTKDGTEQETEQQTKSDTKKSDTEKEIEQSKEATTEQVAEEYTVTDKLIEKYPFLSQRKGQSITEALDDYSNLQTAYGRSQQELTTLKNEKLTNASEETTSQEKELPDPLDDPKGFRDAVLADARKIVEDGLVSVRPLQAESAEKQIVKALTPLMPEGADIGAAMEDFKNDVLVKLNQQERERRINYYEQFPSEFIRSVADHAEISAIRKNGDQETKSKTFKNTRKALKNAESHENEELNTFNNEREVEEKSPEGELLQQISDNIDDDEY